jgi:poly-gamma-glutamate synthesis protein (capsule biosynthesis protein)
VSPSVKVLALGGADLFGSPTHRAVAYPLQATVDGTTAWAAYDAADVRTVISTGDTCPDRGISHQAVFAGKGWDWTLGGGTAYYTGFHMSSYGWNVPDIARRGDSGAVAALISDNDVGVNDFECPMLATWKQHDTGTRFTIDPAVAGLLAIKGGVKTVTLGSNHIANGGVTGIRETLADLDRAGIAHTGAGMTIDEALRPAVVEVRGVRFAFVGWDDGSGTDTATATRPGVAQLTRDNICKSIQDARVIADIVIAEPQWGFPEYHNDMTKTQAHQRDWMYECGADGILGSGTHWASWASVEPGPRGPRFAIGSHGNFLFDQNWSRQTMEGVVVEATFAGTRLVQFRLHPYVILDNGQPNLVEPTTDGAFVMNQVWSVGGVR